VQKWNDGLDVIYLDHLRIRKGSSALGIYADLRIRMWRMWSFDTAGVFGFIGDWFSGRTACDLDGDQCVAVSDIFAFLTAWFDGE
jgi:hypothetical protein